MEKPPLLSLILHVVVIASGFSNISIIEAIQVTNLDAGNPVLTKDPYPLRLVAVSPRKELFSITETIEIEVELGLVIHAEVEPAMRTAREALLRLSEYAMVHSSRAKDNFLLGNTDKVKSLQLMTVIKQYVKELDLYKSNNFDGILYERDLQLQLDVPLDQELFIHIINEVKLLKQQLAWYQMLKVGCTVYKGNKKNQEATKTTGNENTATGSGESASPTGSQDTTVTVAPSPSRTRPTLSPKELEKAIANDNFEFPILQVSPAKMSEQMYLKNYDRSLCLTENLQVVADSVGYYYATVTRDIVVRLEDQIQLLSEHFNVINAVSAGHVPGSLLTKLDSLGAIRNRGLVGGFHDILILSCRKNTININCVLGLEFKERTGLVMNLIPYPFLLGNHTVILTFQGSPLIKQEQTDKIMHGENCKVGKYIIDCPMQAMFEYQPCIHAIMNDQINDIGKQCKIKMVEVENDKPFIYNEGGYTLISSLTNSTFSVTIGDYTLDGLDTIDIHHADDILVTYGVDHKKSATFAGSPKIGSGLLEQNSYRTRKYSRKQFVELEAQWLKSINSSLTTNKYDLQLIPTQVRDWILIIGSIITVIMAMLALITCFWRSYVFYQEFKVKKKETRRRKYLKEMQFGVGTSSYTQSQPLQSKSRVRIGEIRRRRSRSTGFRPSAPSLREVMASERTLPVEYRPESLKKITEDKPTPTTSSTAKPMSLPTPVPTRPGTPRPSSTTCDYTKTRHILDEHGVKMPTLKRVSAKDLGPCLGDLHSKQCKGQDVIPLPLAQASQPLERDRLNTNWPNKTEHEEYRKIRDAVSVTSETHGDLTRFVPERGIMGNRARIERSWQDFEEDMMSKGRTKFRELGHVANQVRREESLGLRRIDSRPLGEDRIKIIREHSTQDQAIPVMQVLQERSYKGNIREEVVEIPPLAETLKMTSLEGIWLKQKQQEEYAKYLNAVAEHEGFKKTYEKVSWNVFRMSHPAVLIPNQHLKERAKLDSDSLSRLQSEQVREITEMGYKKRQIAYQYPIGMGIRKKDWDYFDDAEINLYLLGQLPTSWWYCQTHFEASELALHISGREALEECLREVMLTDDNRPVWDQIKEKSAVIEVEHQKETAMTLTYLPYTKWLREAPRRTASTIITTSMKNNKFLLDAPYWVLWSLFYMLYQAVYRREWEFHPDHPIQYFKTAAKVMLGLDVAPRQPSFAKVIQKIWMKKGPSEKYAALDEALDLVTLAIANECRQLKQRHKNPMYYPYSKLRQWLHLSERDFCLLFGRYYPIVLSRGGSIFRLMTNPAYQCIVLNVEGKWKRSRTYPFFKPSVDDISTLYTQTLYKAKEHTWNIDIFPHGSPMFESQDEANERIRSNEPADENLRGHWFNAKKNDGQDQI